MRYFPQLSTGALAHFPLVKRITRRTVTNRLPDGSTFKLTDSGVVVVEWELAYTGLAAEEAATIEQFFSECEGDLMTFGFLDPTGNLLTWSEDLEQEMWTRDPLLTLTPGLKDPQGGTAAYELGNGSGALQGIRQVVMGPGGFTYCFSVWARSTQRQPLFMTIGNARRQREAGPKWTRFSVTALPEETEQGISFGLETHSGQVVEVFGLQVEAQPAASGYKRTGSTSGLYSSCRFGHSQLRMTADSPNGYSCRLKVISNANSL